MIKKKIANIVFYKTSNTKDAEKLACIFYADGTVSNISFEQGIDACEEIVKEYGIKSKDSFQEMINKQLVHVLSAKEFTERFSSFVGKELVAEPAEESINPAEVLAATTANNQNVESPAVEEKIEESADSKDESDLDEVFAQAFNAVNKETSSIPEPVETTEKKETEGEETSDGKSEEDAEEAKKETEEESKDKDVETGTGEDDPFEEVDETGFIDPEEELTKDGAESIDTEIEDADVIEQGDKDKPKGVKGFFKGIYEKLKKNKTVKKISACVLAFVLATGLFGCSHRKSLEGQMLNSNLATTTTTNTNPLSSRDGILYTGNNDYYDNYSYEELIEVTKNESQKNAMINVHDALMHFNNEFASNYLESNKNIRASLKFDEMIALQMAYNDFSKKDIAAIFNGAEIRSDDLVRSYKDASLQLMGAYAMENSEHPVDMSMLLETEEARAFYNNYHAAFLAAKEATGQDKLDKVKAFYEMVKSDFPITKEVRTEGISHSENYDMIEPYKLSVTPMIAAAEMMFQNLKVDYTLNDSEIDFINDLGLCNYAEETFQRIETITLTSVEDNTNPTYEQYRNAMISKLKAAGYYYVDDETRELTKLDSFQEAVNGDKKGNGNNYTGTTGGKKGTTTTTTTRQEVETHTETTTTIHEEEVRINKPIPADVKAQIDAQIEAENEAARRQAEQQAELERQRLQAIEDENARRIAEEIRREEQDLQNRLQNANNTINSNNSDTNVYNDRVINESDFGDHGVSFDQQHQDGHGNLNNSVQNITTNSDGDQTNVALPDPNETGKKFDQQSTYQTYTQTNDVQLPYTGTTTIDSTNPQDTYTAIDTTGSEYQFWTEESTDQTEDSWTEVSGIQIDPEYQGYVQVSAQSNEQIVNDYVENLSSQPESYGEGYQYTK